MLEIFTYNYAIMFVFCIGYACIIFEHNLGINKASSALMSAILCWTILFWHNHGDLSQSMTQLGHHLAGVSEVILFLLGALTIVEIIHAHNGFSFITDCMHVRSKRSFLWVISIFAFFLSAILDNLTTTLVMISLTSKIIQERQMRLLLGAAIVIAANAGGAWTPMGDVTTTMLWIGGQITAGQTVISLFLPSFACLIVSLLWFTIFLKGDLPKREIAYLNTSFEPQGRLIFFLGIGSLVFVPIFKLFTGMPPYMGILFGLSILWIVTDLIHARHDDRDHLRLPAIFTKVDLSSTLFFLGILLTVGALETGGILSQFSLSLDYWVGSESGIPLLIGLISALVDNVPLVAACMNMYELSIYAQDSSFWQLLAYCAGTGGSVLIIGSAAGVAFMAMEKVSFGWYVAYASIPALIGYLAGFGVYYLFM